ncbi:hypothetical protein M0805_007460 [Coniferiporia weirii]|nr:hypothetical protein M0805_007460 [Coniferiporia weirii]
MASPRRPDFSHRTDSPVPPPCPSPQLKPMPLPTPPIYSRRPASSSQDSLPAKKLKPKRSADLDPESLVYSLKDALVAGGCGSSSRRNSRPDTRDSDYSPSSTESISQRPPAPRRVPSPPSPPVPRKHRRSESNSQNQNILLPSASRSLTRSRTRSPSGRPFSTETPPPVPPLPPLDINCATPVSPDRKTSFIRIPELGLGIDEGLRSPLSPLQSGKRRRERSRKESDAPSFLHMSKRDTKRSSRTSPVFSVTPLAGCLSVRPSHSLPDLKTAKRRSGSTFAGRFLRMGTQSLVV